MTTEERQKAEKVEADRNARIGVLEAYDRLICEACRKNRCHTSEEWRNHPRAGHGFNGVIWTRPELSPMFLASPKEAA
jgi:hypothetical protein